MIENDIANVGMNRFAEKEVLIVNGRSIRGKKNAKN